MSKNSHLDEKEFGTIKKLIAIGSLSHQEIADIVKRSSVTVYTVAKYDTLEDMRNTEYAARKRKHPKPTVLGTPLVEQNPSAQEANEPKTIPDYTELIASIDRLNSNVETMLEAYRWVLEHAQIDTRKKRGFFR